MSLLSPAAASDAILMGLLLFCRIGSCLMLMPGLSSARIPVRPRLYLAVSVALALMPALLPDATRVGTDIHPLLLFRLLAGETLIGLTIGLMGRIFFLALETLATSIAFNIGLGSPLGAPIDESLPIPAIGTLFTLTATMLVFATDLHWEILRGLVASYRAMPIGSEIGGQFALVKIADTLSQSFGVALRVTSPFLVYAVIVNLTLGLVNRLTPQVPVYYISLPFVVAGGLLLLYVTLRSSLGVFTVMFARWLAAL